MWRVVYFPIQVLFSRRPVPIHFYWHHRGISRAPGHQGGHARPRLHQNLIDTPTIQIARELSVLVGKYLGPLLNRAQNLAQNLHEAISNATLTSKQTASVSLVDIQVVVTLVQEQKTSKAISKSEGILRKPRLDFRRPLVLPHSSV